jgi:ABC-type transport system involved in multi-copper enzyme maturation permease subunit
MTVLPVVARELRVASRRGGSYWGRAAAALVAIAVFAWIFWIERQGVGSTGQGQALFGVLSVMAYVFCALAGIVFSADSVSSEKREGTLGLLFLTDLRGHDVALGKLTASSLAGVYALVAALPVLALSLLLGGVTPDEYWRVVLTLLTVLFTSLALGLLASTVASDPWRAGALAFVLIAAWQLLAPIIWAGADLALREMGVPHSERNELWNELQWATPMRAMETAFASNYQAAWKHYWSSLTLCGGVGLAALGASSWRLPKVWQETGVDRRTGFAARLRRLRFPDAAATQRFRTRLLELHPVVWLTGRHWLRAWLMWLTLAGIVGGYSLLALLEGDNEWWEPPALVMLSYLLHVLLKFWMAMEAPRQFFSDRRSGALELLLATPIRAEDLVQGRMKALRRQFLPPCLALIAGDVLVALFAWQSAWDDEWGYWLMAWSVHIVALVADLVALAWFGNWIGLAATGNRTTLHAVLRILVLPWVIWFLGASVLALGIRPVFTDGDAVMLLVLLAWLGLTVVNDVIWIGRARRGLLGRFRELAAQTVRKAGK